MQTNSKKPDIPLLEIIDRELLVLNIPNLQLKLKLIIMKYCIC